eukprot:GHRR01026928.1.p3 GENE.GHRR01026928.1~~GHRR01026928.1.p3  ORF type:complete len:105 (+),score=24.37 GHRR01026928.1:1409-1723(+)
MPYTLQHWLDGPNAKYSNQLDVCATVVSCAVWFSTEDEECVGSIIDPGVIQPSVRECCAGRLGCNTHGTSLSSYVATMKVSQHVCITVGACNCLCSQVVQHAVW